MTFFLSFTHREYLDLSQTSQTEIFRSCRKKIVYLSNRKDKPNEKKIVLKEKSRPPSFSTVLDFVREAKVLLFHFFIDKNP